MLVYSLGLVLPPLAPVPPSRLGDFATPIVLRHHRMTAATCTTDSEATGKGESAVVELAVT